MAEHSVKSTKHFLYLNQQLAICLRMMFLVATYSDSDMLLWCSKLWKKTGISRINQAKQRWRCLKAMTVMLYTKVFSNMNKYRWGKQTFRILLTSEETRNICFPFSLMTCRIPVWCLVKRVRAKKWSGERAKFQGQWNEKRKERSWLSAAPLQLLPVLCLAELAVCFVACNSKMAPLVLFSLPYNNRKGTLGAAVFKAM